MANEERKAQLSFGVDASGVKQGVAEIKRDVREMAQDVQQSGQQAAKGIQAIGDGAPAAAQKMDGATKSIIGSIERATAAIQAGEKGSASYFESLAKQRNANVDVLKPYIEQLRQAEEAQRVASGSLNKMGVSAGQTAAALRGLPAQFSDIVVSLQGGQAPLTVFLQQGAQIKDQFGGAGNAVRAMGGYVMGLINPLSVAAAAVAALGVAYYQGAEQANAFARAVIASGGSSGQTATSLSALAQQAGAVTGRFADARSAALELAGVGTILGGDLTTALRGGYRGRRGHGPECDRLGEGLR
ncbi:phage tail length tape measure family protein [Paracidovorax avenae]|uniref:phage tail length tape measure family protein n=1 Tax=Paracidovorax avenae TaxID=80867 RepID=UPI0009EC6C02|nr:phage tail length tape measure family protein [Paracidovorax avenae]